MQYFTLFSASPDIKFCLCKICNYLFILLKLCYIQFLKLLGKIQCNFFSAHSTKASIQSFFLKQFFSEKILLENAFSSRLLQKTTINIFLNISGVQKTDRCESCSMHLIKNRKTPMLTY